ncbi:MAG: carboxypeptidase-like regulatory domain-containing protein [Saprospiraceae bacterium]
MKKSFTYLFFLFTSTMVFGQKGTLNLIVQDEKNEPLIGATIKVFQNEQLVQGGWSDFHGMAQFQLDPGTYDLSVWYVGLVTQMISGMKISANKEQELQFKLAPSILSQTDIVLGCCIQWESLDPDPENTGTTFQANQIWYSSRMNY